MFKTPKYHNEKVTTSEGVFDSKLEYRRYLYLRDQQQRGRIRNLMRQVRYTLIPKAIHVVPITKHYKPRNGQPYQKVELHERVLYKECTYTADFVYECPIQHPDLTDPVWHTVVEDTKSVATAQSKEFKIKQKLMYSVHHIVLHIVTSPAAPFPPPTFPSTQ